jgi:hypothetical protein
MNYPEIVGEPNFILIGISAVCGLLVIIIVYYIVVSKSSTPGRLYASGSVSNTPMSLPAKMPMGASVNVGSTPQPTPSSGSGYYASANPPTIKIDDSGTSKNAKQVFNIRENIYALEDAPGVCGALGAEVATIDQLIDAHKSGADWCNVGWTKDGLAAFPVQYSTWKTLQNNEPNKRGICGQPGINLVRNDPNLLYGVNCYGVKPDPKGDEKIKQKLMSDADLALQAKIAQFRKNINSIGIAPWNQDKWSA